MECILLISIVIALDKEW